MAKFSSAKNNVLKNPKNKNQGILLVEWKESIHLDISNKKKKNS